MNEAYFVFSRAVDPSASTRMAEMLSRASQDKVTKIHLAMHSAGGGVPDGIAIYNLLRAAPMPIAVYNIGVIASAAVLAFLGAPTRYSTAESCFMVHDVTGPVVGVNAVQTKTIAKSIEGDDKRNRTILKAHLAIQPATLAKMKVSHVFWDATEALKIGLIHEVKGFSVPHGSAFYSV